MDLLDEIITSVTSAKEPVSDILRRCLVLAYRLKNDALKKWVEQELNGYEDSDELPSYRKAGGVAKGLFLGPMGAQLSNQPLPPAVLKKEHKHFATDIRLTQPLAAYDGVSKDVHAALSWPPDLVVLYQNKFFDGYALNRAWMEIPSSLMVSLVDQVRTRILTFALEIQSQLPESNPKLESIPEAVVQRIVNITIHGGNNVVGDAGQVNAPVVIAGDLKSLRASLETIGIGKRDLIQLEQALITDAMTVNDPSTEKVAGNLTMEWIKGAAKKIGGAGLKISGAVAEEAIKRAVFGYLGF